MALKITEKIGSGDSIKSFIRRQLLGIRFLGLQFLTFLASEGPHKLYPKSHTPKNPKKVLLRQVRFCRYSFEWFRIREGII